MKNALFAFFMAAVMISCTMNVDHPQDLEGVGLDEFLAELDYRIAAWEAQGIQAYRFTAQVFSPSDPTIPPITVTVMPGVEPELEYDPEKVDAGLRAQIYAGVPFSPFDGLTIGEFMASMKLIAPSWNIHEANIITTFIVRYNPEYHFPEEFRLRVFQPPFGLLGIGGQGLAITGFQVLGTSSEE